ncbi:sigma-54 dependent transcriptional regulator [Geobacter sp. DSM 9736]|uniref:sigma-54-dependent transcriptional regulator n=1 Tax=Geobacter sp. DSM 9736 TaxID=1277350 RepID=UPI000B501EA0|nr:sigma-54 dependent transcriptional regulator [Geobacter sp. DSM 9736]SNB45396.1 two-component system, NtrC family, response regulator [Geobacter sp. DSM 9736]
MSAKILIIDDDASFRRVLEYNLQEEGYEVRTAASGEDGLALFHKMNPELVITDVKMPGMDGYQVLKAVKKASPQTEVIIITAFGAVGAAVEAMKHGAFDYIAKPFNRDELKVTVRRAIEAGLLQQEGDRLFAPLTRGIIGNSQVMWHLIDIIKRVANTEATVLITGESGTGKELVARALHEQSSRRKGKFLAINCAAIPRELMESELFGHVKGAFTGAVRDKEGKFQQAKGGTIFLDEIGELPLELQPKLLRALQERVVEPVGGAKEQRLDVRVVAATNRDLEKATVDGSFREDLFYRLSVIPISVPSLRERKKDIPLLIDHFLKKSGGAGVSLSEDAMEAMLFYSWPGNVRELENTIERMLIMRTGKVIPLSDLPEKIRTGHDSSVKLVITLPDEGYSLEQLEREVVVQALERNNWNQSAAARFLRIPRHTLLYRLEKYGIVPPEPK